MRSSFEAGAVSIATTVQGTPASRAAYATPCPALPALIVHTPRLRSAVDNIDGVGRAAQLVGVDRLQVLELEPHVGEPRPEVEPHERRADDGARDAPLRLTNLREGDGANGFDRRHVPRCTMAHPRGPVNRRAC